MRISVLEIFAVHSLLYWNDGSGHLLPWSMIPPTCGKLM